MSDSNHPLIKIEELQQVGMVVRNVDKTMESMWNNFGIGPWKVFISDEKVIFITIVIFIA
jgi:hypothetical protein